MTKAALIMVISSSAITAQVIAAVDVASDAKRYEGLLRSPDILTGTDAAQSGASRADDAAKGKAA